MIIVQVDLLSEILSWIGMISILTAFLLETRKVLNSKEKPYLLLMAVGSGLLAIRAALISEWAFLLLEIVWCLAALLVIYNNAKLSQ